jgi:hypothetical protein
VIFDSLLNLFRRGREARDADIEKDEDSLDPLNPFPDPVVVEFGDVIDLHSIPPRQTRMVVEDFLEEARRRRLSCVRIIHGKGEGVQREIVRSVLACKWFVLSFQDAPPEAGGWGATVADLDSKD